MKIWAVAVCAAVAALAVSLSAWAQGGFSEAARTQFLSECAQGGGEAALCQCVWNGVRAEYTPAEFDELDNAYRAQTIHPNMHRQELIVAGCKGDLPSSGRYPAYTVQNFNTGCQGGGVSAAICGCMINNLQRQLSFQDFVELDLMSAWGRDSEHASYPRLVQIAQQCVTENR